MAKHHNECPGRRISLDRGIKKTSWNRSLQITNFKLQSTNVDVQGNIWVETWGTQNIHGIHKVDGFTRHQQVVRKDHCQRSAKRGCVKSLVSHSLFSGLSWITVVNVVVSVDYKWIFVIVVHRHQHVVAGPANHNWGLLAQAQTRVIAVQSPGHIWRANTFNVVQTDGCISLSARLSLPRTVFNVNPDTHIESLESSEKHVVEGTSKWSCKIKVSGKNVVLVSF